MGKWDTFDPYDDIDDVSDDDEFGGDLSLGDLDALSGPREETARIQKHWKREAAALRRAARERTKDVKTKPHMESGLSLPTGPEISRPCVYRPEADPEACAAKAIRRDYDKWKNFDVDAALLNMDNEGKTQEGDALRCEARKGSAM